MNKLIKSKTFDEIFWIIIKVYGLIGLGVLLCCGIMMLIMLGKLLTQL